MDRYIGGEVDAGGITQKNPVLGVAVSRGIGVIMAEENIFCALSLKERLIEAVIPPGGNAVTDRTVQARHTGIAAEVAAVQRFVFFGRNVHIQNRRHIAVLVTERGKFAFIPRDLIFVNIIVSDRETAVRIHEEYSLRQRFVGIEKRYHAVPLSVRFRIALPEQATGNAHEICGQIAFRRQSLIVMIAVDQRPRYLHFCKQGGERSGRQACVDGGAGQNDRGDRVAGQNDQVGFYLFHKRIDGIHRAAILRICGVAAGEMYVGKLHNAERIPFLFGRKTVPILIFRIGNRHGTVFDGGNRFLYVVQNSIVSVKNINGQRNEKNRQKSRGDTAEKIISFLFFQMFHFCISFQRIRYGMMITRGDFCERPQYPGIFYKKQAFPEGKRTKYYNEIIFRFSYGYGAVRNARRKIF